MSIENAILQGIDVKDALKRLRGNEALYIKLLGRFLQASELDALRDAFANGDTAEAAKVAHTIKGAAANLSLVDIQARAVELEQMLKAADGGITDRHRAALSDIEKLFSDTRDNCAPYLS